MKTLLQINASLFANGGQSTQLADAFVAKWRAGHQEARSSLPGARCEPSARCAPTCNY